MLKSLLHSLSLSAAFLAFSAASLAQQVPEAPVGYTGALTEYSEGSVTLRDKDGNLVKVAMTPGWTVSTARVLSAAAITPGSFVATANTNVDANTGKSTELRVFEPGYRPEEGTHSIAQPNTSMTHGTVKAANQSARGLELDVVYPNGSRHIIVAPEVKVTGYEVHERSTLKPGVVVTAVTRKGPDGVRRAGRLVMASP
jgi:hypothetical protein